MKDSINLVHHTPGRSRFRVPQNLLLLAGDRLKNFSPSARVEINRLTRSIVIHHQSGLADLLDYLGKNNLPLSVENSPENFQIKNPLNLGDHLRLEVFRFDNKLAGFSRGQITLKGVVVATLVGLGMYQIFWRGKILPAGVNMLLFAGSILLRPGQRSSSEEMPQFRPETIGTSDR